jgi:glutathione peroxidase|tara:strand:- start:481 stop:1026 length:546 start_codon:yes stop_codon:yes gene_type:complete
MRKILIALLIMFSFFNKSLANYSQLAYDFQFKGLSGELIKLSDYKNKVIVVVNVASRCGFTKQYDDLQNLWNNYKNKDLVVIGIPTNDFKQEPASNSEIKNFCEQNFNINFPMTEKINVLGSDAHPFYKWAKDNHGKAAIPKWNFHKVIIGKDGKIVDTFASITNPSSKRFVNFIEEQIKN